MLGIDDFFFFSPQSSTMCSLFVASNLILWMCDYISLFGKQTSVFIVAFSRLQDYIRLLKFAAEWQVFTFFTGR